MKRPKWVFLCGALALLVLAALPLGFSMHRRIRGRVAQKQLFDKVYLGLSAEGLRKLAGPPDDLLQLGTGTPVWIYGSKEYWGIDFEKRRKLLAKNPKMVIRELPGKIPADYLDVVVVFDDRGLVAYCELAGEGDKKGHPLKTATSDLPTPLDGGAK